MGQPALNTATTRKGHPSTRIFVNLKRVFQRGAALGNRVPRARLECPGPAPLTDARTVRTPEPEVVRNALSCFAETSLDFGDCLLAGRARNSATVATLDRW